MLRIKINNINFFFSILLQTRYKSQNWGRIEKKTQWQQTEDFARKKEIRAHMYKLRENRLRDFYTGDMDASTIGIGKGPLGSSHGDSLQDQSFQSFKTKEIRDSESPTR